MYPNLVGAILWSLFWFIMALVAFLQSREWRKLCELYKEMCDCYIEINQSLLKKLEEKD